MRIKHICLLSVCIVSCGLLGCSKSGASKLAPPVGSASYRSGDGKTEIAFSHVEQAPTGDILFTTKPLPANHSMNSRELGDHILLATRFERVDGGFEGVSLEAHYRYPNARGTCIFYENEKGKTWDVSRRKAGKKAIYKGFFKSKDEDGTALEGEFSIDIEVYRDGSF